MNPNQLGSSWRTVAMKEQSGGLVYALYAHDGEDHTSAHVATPFESRTTGSALAAEHLDARRHAPMTAPRCGC